MGLVMMGRAAPAIKEEMWVYAQETRHEKIIRGLSLGLAFLFYGRQEEADATVREMLEFKVRFCASCYESSSHIPRTPSSVTEACTRLRLPMQGPRIILPSANCCTSLSPIPLMTLGVLLSLRYRSYCSKTPTQVPRMVQLLSESYNPHVRCGATLCVGYRVRGNRVSGTSCIVTITHMLTSCEQDAVDILEPMTKDPVDFVRQGALIALGMVLVQQSEASSPSLSSTRTLYRKIIGDKHEDPMARFGAVLGEGLIDAGGRNVTISLQSMVGSSNASSIVGMALFCSFGTGILWLIARVWHSNLQR